MPDVRPLVWNRVARRLREMVAGDTLAWALLSGVPAFASRWPTYDEVTDKPAFAPLSHTHAAGDIASGTFAAARISQASVVQHQAALVIDWPQLYNAGELGGWRTIPTAAKLDVTIPASADYDSIVEPSGLRFGRMNGASTSSPSFFGGNISPVMWMGSFSGIQGAQIGVYAHNNPALQEMGFRGASAGAFSSWRRIWHDGNFNPDSKFNASGGTIAGSANVQGGVVIQNAAGTITYGGLTSAGTNILVYYAESMDMLFRPGGRLAATGIAFAPTVFRPEVDNAMTAGFASRRFSVFFGATGTINTSDAREKTTPRDLTQQEIACALDIARLPCLFQWLVSIEEKGQDEARLHASPTVQAVIATMTLHGLEPFRYSFVCYDAWPEQPEVVHSWDDEFDDDGHPTLAAGSEVVQARIAAGDRYSLRPSGLEAFCRRALVADRDALHARILAVENRTVQP